MSRIQVVLMVGMAALPSCHRATEQDCEEILDKIVELELRDQGITDPERIGSRKAETREKKREELIHDCVGKRISSSAMDCIRSAQHADEITDKCLH